MKEAPLTDDLSRLAARAAALHAGFSQSFTEPAQIDATLKEDFLAIRIGGDMFAIRLAEITGLHTGKKVTRLPGGEPALIGIAGFRGTILPVYSLTILLGLPAKAEQQWLVIAAAAPVALAFDGFDHHSRVAADTIRPRDANAKDQPYFRDYVPIQQFNRPILHLPSILDAIGPLRSAVAPEQER
jgi:chemotaxis signal transduction protein